MELSLDRKRLDLNFLFCLICLLGVAVVFHTFRLTFFAPFLIIAAYKKPLTACVWIAFGCGFIIDLFSSEMRLGVHAFAYCLTIAIVYPQRRNFFADSISTLPIMTFCFAVISTLMMALLLYSIESRNVFSWPWVLTDLIYYPLMDACYAFLFFILPALVFNKPRRKSRGQ